MADACISRSWTDGRPRPVAGDGAAAPNADPRGLLRLPAAWYGAGQETATAFLGRQEEKARLLAPHLARLQSEFLEPLIRRLFGLLYRAGALPRNRSSALHPDIPTVQLISPLAQAQRLSEAARHLRLLDGLSGLGLEQGQLVDEQALARSILSDAGFPERHLRPDPAP